METVEIVGLAKAEALLSAARYERALGAGLLAAGILVQSEARAVLASHHWHGRAEAEVHAEPRGPLSVFVGGSAAKAPELRPLTYGWHSSSGKQPPTSAIAEWLTSKPEIADSSSVSRSPRGFVRRRGTIGQIAGESAIRSRAFLIARAIGRRGFSFGRLDTFAVAIARARPRIAAVIAAHMRGL
jgi:hypothetical protein